jgi:hypothetical protein
MVCLLLFLSSKGTNLILYKLKKTKKLLTRVSHVLVASPPSSGACGRLWWLSSWFYRIIWFISAFSFSLGGACIVIRSKISFLFFLYFPSLSSSDSMLAMQRIISILHFIFSFDSVPLLFFFNCFIYIDYL